MLRRPSLSRRSRSQFSNIFSSITAGQIKAKILVKPPWEGERKVCINGPGHMTKVAAMPLNGKKKTLKIFYSRTGSPMILELSIRHRGLKLYEDCINGDSGFTYTYFMAISNLVT